MTYFHYLRHRDKIFCIYIYFKQRQLIPFSLRHTVKGYVCHILSFSIWHAQYSKWATYHFIFHRMQYPNLLALIVAKFIQFLDREKEISFYHVLWCFSRMKSFNFVLFQTLKGTLNSQEIMYLWRYICYLEECNVVGR